ncbi:MAG: hypothetical protein QXX87_06330 [Candidatus Jordarchaeales archaeon]
MSGERQRSIRYTRQRCEFCGGQVIFDFSQRVRVCSSCGLVQEGKSGSEISLDEFLRELQFANTIEELAARLGISDWEIERKLVLMQKEGLVEIKDNKVFLTTKGRRKLHKDII